MNNQEEHESILKATQVISCLHRLTVNAFKSEKKQELIFKILNDTIALRSYDRALLWSLDNKKPKLLGASGQSKVAGDTQLTEDWITVIRELRKEQRCKILSAEDLTDSRENWERLNETAKGLSVLYLPIIWEEKTIALLTIEQWNKHSWTDEELLVFGSLMENYATAWMKFNKTSRIRKTLFPGKIKGYVRLFLLATVVYVLFFVKVPLRIVAPCEVIPEQPLVVSASLDEVIDEILVKPGQSVKKDQVLFAYEKSSILEELQVARKKLSKTKATYTKVQTMAAKGNEEARRNLVTLALEIEMGEIELSRMQEKADKLSAKAPGTGEIMMKDPNTWKGKPVRIGEQVMMIVSSKNTKVKIWIPENDNVLLNQDKEMKIILNINPGTTRNAKLEYISSFTQPSPLGVNSFIAEAQWSKSSNANVKLGLKGTAILYGNDVPVIYWICRKPWLSFRKTVGF